MHLKDKDSVLLLLESLQFLAQQSERKQEVFSLFNCNINHLSFNVNIFKEKILMEEKICFTTLSIKKKPMCFHSNRHLNWTTLAQIRGHLNYPFLNTVTNENILSLCHWVSWACCQNFF